jgi:putative hemolysin
MESLRLVSSLANRARERVGSPYEIRFTQDEHEIRAAQRLRYDSFVVESNRLRLENRDRLDQDSFDRYCVHLIAIDCTHGDVVGTYRVLYPEGRFRAGRYYMDQLFHAASLFEVHGQTVEIGRACIHPQARSRALLMRMWSTLAKDFSKRGIRYVVGCASVPIAGSVETAMQLCRDVSRGNRSDLGLTVEPRAVAPRSIAAASTHFPTMHKIAMPALLRGYFELGAKLMGEPAYDEDFDCLDLPLIFDLSSAKSRLARRVLEAA